VGAGGVGGWGVGGVCGADGGAAATRRINIVAGAPSACQQRAARQARPDLAAAARMADTEFEEFRYYFDRLPQHLKAPISNYT
jgi:hypothetical protein